jgi:hypothetical protein
MTIFDGKRPRFYFTYLTNDRRWMIAYPEMDGSFSLLPHIFESETDARVVSEELNNREMAAYKEASDAQLFERIRQGWPTLEEIAARHGMKIKPENE